MYGVIYYKTKGENRRILVLTNTHNTTKAKKDSLRILCNKLDPLSLEGLVRGTTHFIYDFNTQKNTLSFDEIIKEDKYI